MILFAAVLAAVPPTLAQPPTVVDVVSMTRVGNVAKSPDGTRLIYTRSTTTHDPEAGPGDDDTGGWTQERQLVLRHLDTGTERQLTQGEVAPRAAAWHPGGHKLGFVRTVDEQAVLHVLHLGGGEAQTLDLGELAPGAWGWSPDGARLAFLAKTPESEEDKHADWVAGGVRTLGEWDNARLYVADADGGDPVPWTAEDTHIVDFVWAPDSQGIGVVQSRSADPYESFGQNQAAVIRGPDQALVPLIEARSCVDALQFSPDARRVAWQGCVDTLSLQNVLHVAEVDGPGRWNAAAELDPTLGGFAWTAGGKHIVAHLIEGTQSVLWRLRPDGSQAQRLAVLPGSMWGGFAVDRAGKTALASFSSPQQAPRPVEVDLKRGTLRPLFDPNPQTADWTLARQELVSWQSPEGVNIEGLLWSPAEATGPVPLAVMPHGGPDGVSTAWFNPMAHVFASRGYAVLQPNYRGGLGKGRDFYAANRGRLGEIEFMDIEAGVDQLIAQGRVDAERLYYGGWSWGGYLTAWTIGHTDRYRAAVAGAAVVDTVAQYVGSDINHGIAAEWEFKGNPWQQSEAFDRANPARFLADARTPTLVLHGEADSRVPYAQGLTLYRALSDVGCEVQMLAYPGEDHGFRQPAHIVHKWTAWLDWFDGH